MGGAVLHKGGLVLWVLVFLLSACSPSTRYYLKVERHLSQQDFLGADEVIESRQDRYGARNALLYFMDRAATLHYAGRYEESSLFLAQAERLAQELYTKSVTAEVGALLTNDNTLPYEGEDFERVLLHLLWALNYAYLGNLDEALVEARKVDHQLNLLNDRYGEKRVYKEDALARYLSGILFEARGEVNDAWIAYRKAHEAYLDYEVQYGTPVPERLKADLLRITDQLGLAQEHEEYREAFGRVEWTPYRDYRRYGEIVFIAYTGLSPVKEDYGLAVPVPDGTGGTFIVTVAMPRFVPRPTGLSHAEVRVEGSELEVSRPTVLVEDITAIAVKDLEDRIGRIAAKTAARAASKYLLSHAIRRQAAEKGDLARILADLGTNLFSILTEQSDKRSWRTLPDQVWMARLLVPPGRYRVEAEFHSKHAQSSPRRVFEEVRVDAGQKVFLGSRVVGRPIFTARAWERE